MNIGQADDAHGRTVPFLTRNAETGTPSHVSVNGSVLCVFPFYGATDGRLLVSRRYTVGRNRTHGLDKLTGRTLARRSYAAFVEPAAILELAVGIGSLICLLKTSCSFDCLTLGV